MSTLVEKNIINENKKHKKNYVSQPDIKKDASMKPLPQVESEIKASWCDEHVLDDFRW